MRLCAVLRAGGHLPWVLSLLVLGGGSDCVTCVVLEIRRVDVMLLVLVLLWCWTLHVALARSCIVPGISAQSVCCLLLYSRW